MKYVIFDPEGSTRARFRSLREVREWAHELRAANPELADEMMLVTYDAAGNKVGSTQWLTDFVPDYAEETAVGGEARLVVTLRGIAEVSRFGEAAPAGWFGTAVTTTHGSHRPHTRASGTRNSEAAQMVGS